MGLFKDFEKVRKFNIYYLAAVSFIVAFGRVFDFEYMSLGRHPQSLLPVPVILTLYLTIRERRYKWPITYREKVFGAYLIFILLMPVWGLYLDKTLSGFKNFWPSVLFAFILMYNVRDEKDLRCLIFAFLSGTVLRGGVSAWDFFASNAQPVMASFKHRNAYSNFLLGPLSILYGLLLYHSKNPLQKIMMSIAFLISLGALMFTLARAPLIAFLFSFFFVSMLVLSRKAKAIVTSIIVLLSFTLLFSGSVISERIRSVELKDYSLQYRIQTIWPETLHTYANNNLLLGNGFGSLDRLSANYRPVISKETPRGMHAHNHLLQALFTQGLIGVFIYLFYVYQTARLSWIMCITEETGFIKGIGAGGLVWIISYTLTGLVHHEFLQSRFNMGFALMVTIILLSFYVSIQKEGQKA